MARILCAVALTVWALAGSTPSSAALEAPSSRPLQYIINCEGCHKADGSGQPGFVPEFRNHISSYLSLPGGREYLLSVPGVAQSTLSDRELADVMNWMLETYDPQGLPAGFEPYTASEVGALRKSPLSDAARQRSRVLARMVADPEEAVMSDIRASSASADRPGGAAAGSRGSVEQPDSFAICAACHPVSADGANGMGPNLRGVIGRRGGVNPGFGYSGSLQSAAVVWTESVLDTFIESPRKVISNTTMTFMGEPDAQRRAEIINYLKSLQ